MTRAGWAVVGLLFTACQTVPQDPFGDAQAALQHGDLLTALVALDQIPVGDPRYPEARAAAGGVERQMRKSHELLLGGLWLRSEWRDEEAILSFQRAQSVWPAIPGVPELIAATQSRMQLFVHGDGRKAALLSVITRPAAPASERPAAMAEGVPAVPPAEPPAAPQMETQPGRNDEAGGEDFVAARLAAIEADLQAGKLEIGLEGLMNLWRQRPADPRLRLRLSRVLHQRALVRYGQGALEQAISDWRRAISLTSDDDELRSLLDKAGAELRRRNDG